MAALLSSALVHEAVQLSPFLSFSLAVHSYPLTLRSAFGTAHSSSTSRTNALLKIVIAYGEKREKQLVGYGEVGLPPKKKGCYECDLQDVAIWTSKCAARLRALLGDTSKSTLSSSALLAQLQAWDPFSSTCLSDHFHLLRPGSAASVSLVSADRDPVTALKGLFYILDVETSCNIKGSEEQRSAFFPQLPLLPSSSSPAKKRKLDQGATPAVAAPLRGVDSGLWCQLEPQWNSVRGGLECCLINAWAKHVDAPIYQLLSPASSTPMPPPASLHCGSTYFTAALNDDILLMVAAAQSGLEHTPLLKIKLDANLDRGLIILDTLYAHWLKSSLASTTPLPLVKWTLDANSAWTPALALRYLAALKSKPYFPIIFMVEQPFPLYRAHTAYGSMTCQWCGQGVQGKPAKAGSPAVICKVGEHADLAEDLQAWQEVKQQYGAAGILIFADESVSTAADVDALAPLVHGVNFKMEKAGGYRAMVEGLQMARAHGLAVWVGIMVASQLNCDASAQVLPLFFSPSFSPPPCNCNTPAVHSAVCASRLASYHYCDLDGALLVTEASSLFAGGFSIGLHGKVVLGATGPAFKGE